MGSLAVGAVPIPSARMFTPPGSLSDDDDEHDLGEGTSKGPRYRTSQGPTIADLLATRINFVPASIKHDDAHKIPYRPINAPPPAAVTPSDASPSASKANGTSHPLTNGTSPSSAPTLAAPSSTRAPTPLFPTIDSSVGWAKPFKVGKGLRNLGNTCYLNSALQVLLHTPPLVRYIEELKDGHSENGCNDCPVAKGKKGFCMACAMKNLITQSFKTGQQSYTPRAVTQNLKKIAAHLRTGRQEDSHEFLRFCIDSMQLGALHGKSPKLEQRLKDSTYVHQIFGGRLRSRVKCMSCDYCSDTFDSILDLSLDLLRTDSLKGALDLFCRVDKLTGSNKYKCEKCKKLVNAEKSFTIEEAPLVLTIHLKRFRPGGGKNNDLIKYPEVLDISPFMSEKASSPRYRLYGVINHSGGGPNSGHYVSSVRAANGSWFNMNDDFVAACNTPLNQKNAYVLFYIREKGDALRSAIHSGVKATNGGSPHVNGKRPRESDAAEGGGPSKKAAVAGAMPSPRLIAPKAPPVVGTSPATFKASPLSTSAAVADPVAATHFYGSSSPAKAPPQPQRSGAPWMPNGHGHGHGKGKHENGGSKQKGEKLVNKMRGKFSAPRLIK